MPKFDRETLPFSDRYTKCKVKNSTLMTMEKMDINDINTFIDGLTRKIADLQGEIERLKKG